MPKTSCTTALAATLVLTVAAVSTAQAQSCSAYPTGTADRIESTDLAAKLGAMPAPKKALHFAYVTKTLINEFWQDVASGIKAEAGKYNIKVDVQAGKDESSLVEQLNLAQTMLSRKPDALLLSPQSDSNLAPVIQAARKQNIPTIIIDDARTPGASSYIGTDQVAIGAKAAEFLHQIYPNGGKVAQIEGQAGSPNARKRIQGFEGTLKKYPNLKLVASQPGNWDRLTAMNASTNILRQHPDLVGIYANNDGMALGVVEAVRNAHKLQQVAVVGTDGIRQAKKSIADGEERATVAEFPYEEGILGVKVALRLLGCQPVPPWVVSPQAVITKQNVGKFPNPPGYKG
ncbi:MAG: substrate-binding domain-containing protein [Rhodospirillales bacterium]|nr:substrate-binding domain-containing protein [Rhodospirillales bacterium]